MANEFAARTSVEQVEEGAELAPKFDADGLIPAVTTAAETGELLMVGYMNAEALRKTIETTEHVEARKSWTPIVIVTESAAAAVKPEAAPEKEHMLRNMALFLSAPFFGLLYAVLLPFVGLGMLLWVATEGLREGRAVAIAPAARQVEPAAAAVATTAVAAAAETTQAHGAAGAALVAVKLAAAPFAGLVFIVALPVAGVAALMWMGLKAAIVHTA